MFRRRFERVTESTVKEYNVTWEREREGESECVCVRERESVCVYIYMWVCKREREKERVSEWERECAWEREWEHHILHHMHYLIENLKVEKKRHVLYFHILLHS